MDHLARLDTLSERPGVEQNHAELLRKRGPAGVTWMALILKLYSR